MKNIRPFTILCMLLLVPVMTLGQEPASCDFSYGTYTDLAPMPVKVANAAAGSIDGKIYLTGGFDVDTNFPFPDDIRYRDHLSVYDPETDTWDTTGTPVPVKRLFFGAGDAALDGKFYAIGGMEWLFLGADEWQILPYARVDVYDPQSDTWESKSNLPIPIGGKAVCRLDGKLYVTGGVNPDQTLLNTLFRYDPATDQWTELTGMNYPRSFHTSVALNGKIYVLGGSTSIRNNIATCEVYDPLLDRWSVIAPIPQVTGLVDGISFSAASAVDGDIYLFGGMWNVNRDIRLETIFRYHPETNTWNRIDHQEVNIADHALLANGRTIYLLGGRYKGEVVEEKAYAYTPSEVLLDSMIHDTVIDGDAVIMDLSEHFSHVDGGQITYSVCLDDQGVVEASVDGSMLTVTGLAAGEAEVSILAESGEDQMGGAFKVNVITAIREVYSLPVSLHIYPNPSLGSTTLAFTVQTSGMTRIEVCDLLGKRVAVPLNEFRTAGEYEFQLNTAGWMPGIYFCRLHTPAGTATVKLMVEQ